MNGGYTDSELEAMLLDPESELSERKESLRGDSPARIRQAICAFANDLPDYRRPGVVFVGVQDSDGRPVGADITDQMQIQLADMKTDGRIVPPPSLSVQKRRLLGGDVAVVLVQPSDSPPVRCDGGIWIRIGSRRGLATAQDERILNEKRRSLDQHFDARAVPGARIEDLDLRLFREEYLRAAFDIQILEANDRGELERLAATKMIVSVDDPRPTVAGILTLGHHPQDFLPGAYVQFLRLDSLALTDAVIDEATLLGPIAQVIRQLDDKLMSHNRTHVEIRTASTELRTDTFPMVSLQQLTRNAILHRTYEDTNAPVRIYWYNDRIEIASPGGSYGIVTPALFGLPGVTDYRNPNLADAMKVLGFVQRFGLGIQEARRALEDAGHPAPQFQVETNWINCVVWGHQ